MKTGTILVLFLCSALNAQADCIADYQAAIKKYTALVQSENQESSQIQSHKHGDLDYIGKSAAAIGTLVGVGCLAGVSAAGVGCLIVGGGLGVAGAMPAVALVENSIDQQNSYFESEEDKTKDSSAAMAYYLQGIQNAYAMIQNASAQAHPATLQDAILKQGNANRLFCSSSGIVETADSINGMLATVAKNQQSGSDPKSLSADMKVLAENAYPYEPTAYLSPVVAGAGAGK